VKEAQSGFEILRVAESGNGAGAKTAGFPTLPVEEPHSRRRKRREEIVEFLQLVFGRIAVFRCPWLRRTYTGDVPVLSEFVVWTPVRPERVAAGNSLR